MKKVGWILIAVLGIAAVLLFVRSKTDSKAKPQESLPVTRPDQTTEQTVSENSSEESAVEAIIVESEDVGELNLSDEVAKLLSSETSFTARAGLIKELSRNLSANDITALREFLGLPKTASSGTSAIALNSLKNDVLEVLMDQYEMPEGLGRQVAEMFSDPNADYMWREYCLQFMAPFLSKGISNIEQGTPNSEGMTEEMVMVESALFSALDERDEDLAGTALLGLDKLGKKYDDFDHSEVIVKAVEMAEDTHTSSRCRLTAMRVAAAAESEDILPTARELAQNAETDLLQGAAITTLGDFADPQDKELLTQLAATGNRQISAAARAALSRFEN